MTPHSESSRRAAKYRSRDQHVVSFRGVARPKRPRMVNTKKQRRDHSLTRGDNSSHVINTNFVTERVQHPKPITDAAYLSPTTELLSLSLSSESWQYRHCIFYAYHVANISRLVSTPLGHRQLNGVFLEIIYWQHRHRQSDTTDHTLEHTTATVAWGVPWQIRENDNNMDDLNSKLTTIVPHMGYM